MLLHLPQSLICRTVDKLLASVKHKSDELSNLFGLCSVPASFLEPHTMNFHFQCLSKQLSLFPCLFAPKVYPKNIFLNLFIL